MGAIAGVFSKDSSDPKAFVEDMLLALRHRGTERKTVLTENAGGENYGSAIGCCSHQNLEAHIAGSMGATLSLDGSFFEVPQKDQANFAYGRFIRGRSVRRTTIGFMREPGGFASLCYSKKRLYAFRDLNGLKPLYYSHSPKLVAFASERKALWKIGLKDVKRVLLGRLHSVGLHGLSVTPLAQLPRSTQRTMTMRQASLQLARLLKRSIRRVTRWTDRVAVAFSGGLDSALTAVLAKNAHAKIELVSVGLSGSPELSTVEKYARELDLPITVETFNPDSLEEYVRRVVWLIEEPNLMKVSVAVPLHWAAMVAGRRGLRTVLCGQGSDELYGGYYKYARTLDTKGRKALVSELYRSVIRSSQINYERDDQATSPFGIELRTPFADLDVIRFSMGIPSDFKVRPGNDLTRKWVLRNVAKNVGVPDDIVWRRKKAIQHGTGVENALRKLARRNNLTTEAYLAKIHAEVINMESMP